MKTRPTLPAPPAATRLHFPHRALLLLSLGLLALSPAPASAENWPMWRGPRHDGTSADPNPPLAWSPEAGIAWKSPIPGYGSSTPAVWGDRVFLTTQTEEHDEFALAVSAKTGGILWQAHVGRGFTKSRNGANMANPSPATDGEVVVVSFGTGELAAFDPDGRELWKRDLQEGRDKTVWWGYAISPVIDGDRVFTAVIDEGDSFVLAVDRKSGEILWKIDRPTEATGEPTNSYATPLIYDSKGRRELFVTGGTWATAYAPETGALLWKASIGGDRTIVGPTFHEDTVYVTSGKRGPIFAIETGGSGDVTKSAIRWSHEKSTPDCPTPVVVGPYLFAVNDSGIALCLRRSDGNLMWQERVGGDYSSSPIVAGGNIYFSNQRGETTVVRGSGEKFEALHVNSLGDEAAMASLAIAHGRIYQRSRTHLYCIGGAKSD